LDGSEYRTRINYAFLGRKFATTGKGMMGLTAMHMAALNDDVKGVELLLRYGADKDCKAEDGQTALDMARSEKAEAVMVLLSQYSIN